jgi:pyridoxamine 5'-phosphate oxidase
MDTRSLTSAPPTLINVPDRQQYTRGSLELDQLDPSDPIQTFTEWFDYARNSSLVTSPEAVVLSTAHLPSGRISSRTVLMKQTDARGFIIYSNFQTSRKSRDLATNPRAALNFWWEPLERQVRVEGVTERLAPEESQIYASTRPRDSQLGAWASPQSSVIENREDLESKVEDVHQRFADTQDIPIPTFWGGLRIVPEVVEFWQGDPVCIQVKVVGRKNRLHDRFVYTKQETGNWRIERLAP